MDSPVDVDLVDEELAIGPRRVPRALVRLVVSALVTGLIATALMVAAQPEVAAGHGSVAAATAARYHADHAAQGNRIRGFFLM